MAKKLGKGLDDLEGLSAIFGDSVNDVLEDIQKGNKKMDGVSDTTSIPLKDIKANPYQPRKEFDQAKLEELSESIKTHGVFQPILVKKTVKGYELIAGERRLRASKMAGLKEIPAIIVEFNDQQMMEIALLENIQREDLNVIEEAQALSKMSDKLGYTQEELAKRIGKSREHVTNTLRLLKLPTKIQDYVVKKQLSMGHVRSLLALDSEEDMLLVAKQAIKEKLSVRAVEKLVKDYMHPETKKQTKAKDTTYDHVSKLVQDKLQTKVNIDANKIVITYHGNDDLNRILELIDCLEEE